MNTERDVYDIDTSGAVEALTQVEHAAHDTKEAHDELNTSLKKIGDELSENLSKKLMTAEAQYELLKEAVHEVTEYIKEGIEEWKAQAEAVARQDVLLRNHGANVAEFREKLEAQRKELEKTLGVEEAYTANLQNVILTMGVAADEVARFTEDSIKLSKVMGQDAVTAARLLARAHSEGKEELKKYGITIKETAELGGSFNAVLKEVEERTRGINEAMPEYTRLTNQQSAAWGEAKKKVGEWGAELWVWLNQDTLKASELLAKVEKASLDAHNMELKGILEAHGLGEKSSPSLDLPTIDIEIQTPEYKARVKADRAERVKEMGEFVKQLHQAQQKAVAEIESEDAATRQESLDKLTNFYTKKAKEQKDYEEGNAAIQREINKQAVADAEEAARAEVDAQKKKAEEIKQIHEQMMSEFKGYAQQVLNGIGSMIGEALTSNTQFNQKMKEAQIDREVAAAKELGQNKSRVEIEKQLQKEQQASTMQRIADVLQSIAVQAGIKAVMEGVEAIASAAEYDYGAAAQHGLAAAGFAAVAIAAGGSAYALSASRGMTTQERQQLEQAQKTKQETAAREEKQSNEAAKGTAPVINVYYLGITGKTTAEQGRELDAIYKEYDSLKTGS